MQLFHIFILQKDPWYSPQSEDKNHQAYTCYLFSNYIYIKYRLLRVFTYMTDLIHSPVPFFFLYHLYGIVLNTSLPLCVILSAVVEIHCILCWFDLLFLSKPDTKTRFELGVFLVSAFQGLISLLKVHMTKLPTLVGHLEVTGYFTGVKECTAYHLKTKLLRDILLIVKPLVSKLQIHNDVNSDSEGGSETLHFLSPHRSQQLLIVNCCGLVTHLDPHPATLRHPPNSQTSQLQPATTQQSNFPEILYP